MGYNVKEITNKEIWEDFSLNISPNTFLQSWNWGEFNSAFGRKIWRIGLFEKEQLIGICLLIKYPSRFGSYLYAPRGPILSWKSWKEFDNLFAKIKEIAKEEGVIFIKTDPLLPSKENIYNEFKKRKFVSAETFIQVEDAWLLPLDEPEDELLANMRKTTRYLIRAEEKQGVTIEQSNKPEDARKFVDLLYSTATRKGFINHPKDYYLKQFEILSPENQEKIFISKKVGKTQAMAIISFYGESACYLHGASLPAEKGSSVGYLLQWEAIKEAKRRGCKYYNFWGVVKDKHFHPGHPWYGFSLFKRGFGGYKYSYLRAQDYPLNSKYYIYRAAEKARRLLRMLQYGYLED
jgi:lipid II:glycine glycyltransferase (peptidoglycan interpeptide bridge formation enzyme)